MNFIKENKYDIGIISTIAIWSFIEFCNIAKYYNNIICILVAFIIVSIFPLLSQENKQNKKLRNKAMIFSITLGTSTLAAIKIVNLLRDKDYNPSAIKVIFYVVLVQSIYFLIKKYKIKNNYENN